MQRHHISYKPSNGLLTHQFSKLENSLGIEHTDYLWNKNKKELVLIMETNQMFSREVKAILKGNRLTLEAPLLSSYAKPFRTHLLGSETKEEFEEGLSIIGFSEIKLKYGYLYHLISCQAIDQRMIKVILGYTLWGRNGKHFE